MYAKLDHPFPDAPAPGQVHWVLPGIGWVRMPLPFALDHINLWVLDDGDGWTLVDTGVGDQATQDLWEALFAGPLAGKPVTRLVCTHFHPDHMGLAGPLCERWGIPLTATLGEWLFGRMLLLDHGEQYVANQIEHYRRAGYDAELLAGIAERGNNYRTRVAPLPAAVAGIRAGDKLVIGGRNWQVLGGNGHSPEHAALYCAELGVLISGDQILPRISPIVGVWPQEPEGDPLGDFLASLDRLRDLPEDTLVLPSHHLPFRGLHPRADELRRHHDVRLERCLAACVQERTALEIAREVFRRPLDAQQTGFATGETLAHLHLLMRQGKLERRIGADGIRLYRKV